MNWKARASLLLIFVMMFTLVLREGLYRPRDVGAISDMRIPGSDISINSGWTFSPDSPSNLSVHYQDMMSADGDTTYARISSTGSDIIFGYSTAFSIPSNATITGVTLHVNCMATSGTNQILPRIRVNTTVYSGTAITAPTS